MYFGSRFNLILKITVFDNQIDTTGIKYSIVFRIFLYIFPLIEFKYNPQQV